jgi:predicted nucleic-acid-binding Zn-ribbon protein
MKYSYCCPKCQNSEIAIIEGGTFKGNIYNTVTFGLTTIYLTRYVCTNCGFTENYIDDVKDLQKIKDKYIKPNNSDGFV